MDVVGWEGSVDRLGDLGLWYRETNKEEPQGEQMDTEQAECVVEFDKS